MSYRLIDLNRVAVLRVLRDNRYDGITLQDLWQNLWNNALQVQLWNITRILRDLISESMVERIEGTHPAVYRLVEQECGS